MNANCVSGEELLLFKKVIEVLNKLEINYWLDQGSLLGVIRDGAFLPWDHDIDLGVRIEEINKSKKLFVRELRRFGVNVDVLPYMIITKYERNGVNNIPVHLKFYFVKDGYAYAEFRSFENLNNFTKKTIKRLIWRPIKYGRKFSFYCHDKIGQKGRYRNIFRLLYGLNIIQLSFFVRCKAEIRNRYVTFRVKEEFFRDFKEIKVYGVSVKIPHEVEKYLDLKFGDNWKTPVKEWKWWKDDGALYKVEYRN